MSPRRKKHAMGPARPYNLRRRDEIVAVLRVHGPMTADDLLRHLPIVMATLTHHLRVAESTGAIVSRLETWEEVAYRVQCGAKPHTRRKPVYAAVEGEAP